MLRLVSDYELARSILIDQHYYYASARILYLQLPLANKRISGGIMGDFRAQKAWLANGAISLGIR